MNTFRHLSRIHNRPGDPRHADANGPGGRDEIRRQRTSPAWPTSARLTPTVRADDPAAAQKPPAGFPATGDIQRRYDDADFNRAVQAYKFFYPTVSIAGTWKGNLDAGLVPNKVFGILEGNPKQLVFTPNSDTPYAGLPLDLTAGPMVVELPPGPLMCVVNDLNQRYVMDLGLPGPDAGKGGKHLILPPGYKGESPEGLLRRHRHHQPRAAHAPGDPPEGERQAAIDMMKTVKIHPLNAGRRLVGAEMDQPDRPGGGLHARQVGDQPRLLEGAARASSTPNRPTRPTGLLRRARRPRHRQGQAVRARRPHEGHPGAGRPDRPTPRCACSPSPTDAPTASFGRIASGSGRALRPENGTFDAGTYVKDLDAREKWFFQAQIESPGHVPARPGAGSLYWLGVRDGTGAYLDGGRTYKLIVPATRAGQAVLVHHRLRRREPQRDSDRPGQGGAALAVRAAGRGGEKASSLYFGPRAPAGKERRVDQDDAGQGVVRLLPDLRAGGGRVRRGVEAGGFRDGEVAGRGGNAVG